VEKNIAERKRHEAERLHEAKFSAIGRLAAGITHEINTPLTYMRGNLEMLSEDVGRVEEPTLKGYLQEDVATVMEGVNRIANIVESMREMASQSSEKLAIHNLYATLVTALTMAYNRSKQICTIMLQDEPFAIGMDKERYRFDVCIQRQRIEQVWIVIINNALDVLKKIEPYEARSLTIRIEALGTETVTIHFHDNGGGIDEEMLPRLFDPFESTKQEGGIGIGLNIARNIVEMHHGRIEAGNREGGAFFSVTLPVACPADELEG
jgi:signal transduction histidine kinase